MKHLNWFIMVVLPVIIGGCNSKEKDNAVVNFTRDNFKQQVTLSNPEEIILEETLDDPTAFFLMHDSVVIVQNQTHCDYMIELFSLNSKKQLAQLATKGNGPDEFKSCFCFVHSNDDPLFYLKDDEVYSYMTVNLDSTLQSKKLNIQQRFQYNQELHYYVEICPVDNNHYVGYHMWYLNDSTYNNNIPNALTKYAMDEKTDESNSMQAAMTKYKYFVASVNDVHLFMNPSNKQIWMADAHRDKIEIYNDSLHVVKTLSGPDNYNIKYCLPKSNSPIPFVGFEGEKSYRSYSNWTFTDKHVYIIYEGLNGGEYNIENLQPVEVFKFDWDGNLLCNYKLDRYVTTLSVDSKEKYLYCTSRKSFKDTAQFIRYKL